MFLNNYYNNFLTAHLDLKYKRIFLARLIEHLVLYDCTTLVS